jgi:dihydroflavonol-4-reductase
VKVKSLIVGGSGHLGAHLARALLARKIETRVLVRPSSQVRGLEGLDIDLVKGDVRDRESLRDALKGCVHVYHLAAPTSHDSNAREIILEGTRLLLEECERANVARIVVTSSTVTVGYSSDPSKVLDESDGEQSDATPYHGAKWLAERLALEFGARSGVPVIIVNPSSIVGSLDFRVTPSNAPLQRCLDHGLPVAFRGGLTIAHAADVADGHILAMMHGVAGERYILGGERLTIPDYFALVSQVCQKRTPILVAPSWAMAGAGLACSAVLRLGITSVPFSYGQIRNIVDHYAWYSSEKARGALGYRWKPALAAVADYVEWVRSGRPVGMGRAQHGS